MSEMSDIHHHLLRAWLWQYGPRTNRMDCTDPTHQFVARLDASPIHAWRRSRSRHHGDV